MPVYEYKASSNKLNLVAGGTFYTDSPIGSIIPYGGATAPNGFLLCQGQAVSRNTYAELFAVIGTAFGAGDGSTTFNVPDLREATTKGVGLSSKSAIHYDSDGVALGEFVEDRVQDHNHRTLLYNMNFQVGAENIAPVTETGGSGIGTVGDIVVGRHGNTTEVKAVGVNYIIKTKHTPVPTDFADSLVGYVGQETNYNLYPWSNTRTSADPVTYLDFTVEKDGWYSVDFTLEQSDGDVNGFAIRDFDAQGGTHTIGRGEINGCTRYRNNIIVPLKVGMYRYQHHGAGSLSVYMNRRDFA